MKRANLMLFICLNLCVNQMQAAKAAMKGKVDGKVDNSAGEVKSAADINAQDAHESSASQASKSGNQPEVKTGRAGQTTTSSNKNTVNLSDTSSEYSPLKYDKNNPKISQPEVDFFNEHLNKYNNLKAKDPKQKSKRDIKDENKSKMFMDNTLARSRNWEPTKEEADRFNANSTKTTSNVAKPTSSGSLVLSPQ